jgi:hypothetical protein
MTTDTDILPAYIKLTNYRTLKISIEESTGVQSYGVKLVIETRIANGQSKQFGFVIPFAALTSTVNSLAAAEQFAIDQGIIAQVDDNADQVDGGAAQ